MLNSLLLLTHTVHKVIQISAIYVKGRGIRDTTWNVPRSINVVPATFHVISRKIDYLLASHSAGMEYSVDPAPWHKGMKGPNMGMQSNTRPALWLLIFLFSNPIRDGAVNITAAQREGPKREQHGWKFACNLFFKLFNIVIGCSVLLFKILQIFLLNYTNFLSKYISLPEVTTA